MAYKVSFTEIAKKEFNSLDSVIKKQLAKKIIYFSSLDDIKVVAKKLHNHEIGEYRLRVGNYRIIFDLDKHTINILRIQHRKDVYK